MSLTTEAAVKELQAAPSVFLACSRYTNLPYVTEGEETANDQVWIFAKEQDIVNYFEVGEVGIEHALLPEVYSSFRIRDIFQASGSSRIRTGCIHKRICSLPQNYPP